MDNPRYGDASFTEFEYIGNELRFEPGNGTLGNVSVASEKELRYARLQMVTLADK
jgi:hypothetical protein